MIDFPTLYPSLVKYLPNWLERFYPSLAQFARGEGYPCGNQGVFIPRRNKCWTHPKTGQRLKKPLTYQMYKDAKEKSQRSRTEKGRTALETREQSFRDKAREKVKGWQKNKEEDVNSRPIPKHPTITETPFTEVNQLLGLRGYSLPDSSDMSKYVLYTAANKVRKDIKSEQDVVDEIKSNPRFNDEMSKLFGIPDTEEKIKLKQQAVDYFDKHSAKWKPIQDQGLREKVNRMTGKPATKSEPKQTPNSSGESGKAITVSTPDKKVEQKYKDIIASSKHPERTEEILLSTLRNGISDFDRENYTRYSTAINSGTVPKGYENHYREKVNTLKPVIEAEKFISERRQKAIAGEYETEKEAGVYVLNKLKEKGYKEHEYYDSPDYAKDYDKLKSVMKSDKLPPPLSGFIPGKDIKQTIKQGDQLLYKKDAYSLGANSPSGYEISDAGEVVGIGFKNVKTRSNSEYMGRLYENEGTVPLDKISHIIRDGKRYKVDPSDSSPNDLGIPESSKPRARKRAKKNDFNSHQLLAQFGSGSLRRRKSKQTTCCCNSPNSLRRRKTKQTAKLRRRGNKYA